MAKFDAVVIGAGTGGLSAALGLAVKGKKVLLLEKHNLPGGCSTSFVRGRFEFDASLHEYCAIGSKGNYGIPGKIMMEDYGMNVDWILAPDLYRCIGTTRSGKHFDVTLPCGDENVIKKMEEVVPGSEKPMRTFFALADECLRANDYFSSHMDKFDKKGFVKTDALYYMKHYPNFLRLAERPFNAVLRKIKMPEDAIDILNVYWTYVGTDYEHLSFIHMAWMFLEYVRLKPAICKGTAHEMSVSAIERLRQLGGEIWQNVEATKVVGNDKGQVIGVQTSAGFVETNYVIANMNPETAYTKLLDKNIKVPDREYRRLNAETHGVRFFNAYVALNKSVEQLGIKDYTIFMPGSFDTKKNFEDSKHYEGNDHSIVVIYNVLNPDISPKGTTVMTFTIAYTEEVWDKVSQRDYVKKKEELFSHVMANFEHDTGIIIHDSIEEIELASPWTFARYLGTPEGTTYGYEITDWDTMVSRLMAIRKDEPIHGFKTVGAAGANGDGYSQTYINGELIANMLVDEMKEDGR